MKEQLNSLIDYLEKTGELEEKITKLNLMLAIISKDFGEDITQETLFLIIDNLLNRYQLNQKKNFFPIIKVLAEKLNRKDFCHFLLDKFLESQHLDLIEVFISANKSWQNKSGHSLSTQLIKNTETSLAIVELMIKHGANVLSENNALLSFFTNSTSLLNLLIDKNKASLTEEFVANLTLLGLAIQEQKTDMVALILKKLKLRYPNERLLISKSRNISAINYVIRFNQKEIFDTFIKVLPAKITFFEQDSDGYSSLDYIAMSGRIELAEKLHKHKKTQNIFKQHINILNKHSQTPLIMALIENQLEIADWFLDHGADVTFKDKDGYDALFWAKWLGPKAQHIVEKIEAKLTASQPQPANIRENKEKETITTTEVSNAETEEKMPKEKIKTRPAYPTLFLHPNVKTEETKAEEIKLENWVRFEKFPNLYLYWDLAYLQSLASEKDTQTVESIHQKINSKPLQFCREKNAEGIKKLHGVTSGGEDICEIKTLGATGDARFYVKRMTLADAEKAGIALPFDENQKKLMPFIYVPYKYAGKSHKKEIMQNLRATQPQQTTVTTTTSATSTKANNNNNNSQTNHRNRRRRK